MFDFFYENVLGTRFCALCPNLSKTAYGQFFLKAVLVETWKRRIAWNMKRVCGVW
jgi:hypothetical protein